MSDRVHVLACADHRPYAACSRLSDEEYRARREAFFGSIHVTLNHLMVGDRIWLARFGGEKVPSKNLDAALYEDFTELRRAREAEDDRIEAFVPVLDEVFLERSISYANSQGRTVEETPPGCWWRTSPTTRLTTGARYTTCSVRRRSHHRYSIYTVSCVRRSQLRPGR